MTRNLSLLLSTISMTVKWEQLIHDLNPNCHLSATIVYLCGRQLRFDPGLCRRHLRDSGLEASNFLLTCWQLALQRRLLSLQSRPSKLHVGELAIQPTRSALELLFFLPDVNSQYISSSEYNCPMTQHTAGFPLNFKNKITPTLSEIPDVRLRRDN